MADKSDSSFSYIEEYNEDSENDSFFYDSFVENEVLVDVDFGDDHTDTTGKITEISEIMAGNEVAAGGEAQPLANSKMSADVWNFFT